jgi:hypothetical protein
MKFEDIKLGEKYTHPRWKDAKVATRKVKMEALDPIYSGVCVDFEDWRISDKDLDKIEPYDQVEDKAKELWEVYAATQVKAAGWDYVSTTGMSDGFRALARRVLNIK